MSPCCDSVGGVPPCCSGVRGGAGLARLFAPEAIAVVGSARECGRVVAQNRALGFAGALWPVHPTRSTVAGEQAYPRVADLPGVPDAAFVAVPAPACATVVAELAALGCGGAVVYSSGFAETGPAGAERQRALLAAAGAMPLLGPNCYGLVNYAERALVWPDQHGGVALAEGERGVAVVSQSSSIAISVTMADTGLPLASVVTVGNAARLGVAAVAAALLDSERVSAVGMIVESLADLRGLGAAGRVRPRPPDRAGRAGARAQRAGAGGGRHAHGLARGRRRGGRGVPAPQRDRPGRLGRRAARRAEPAALRRPAGRHPAHFAVELGGRGGAGRGRRGRDGRAVRRADARAAHASCVRCSASGWRWPTRSTTTPTSGATRTRWRRRSRRWSAAPRTCTCSSPTCRAPTAAPTTTGCWPSTRSPAPARRRAPAGRWSRRWRGT